MHTNYAFINTHTHTHTHTHTCARTRTHIQTRMHAHTYTLPCTRSHGEYRRGGNNLSAPPPPPPLLPVLPAPSLLVLLLLPSRGRLSGRRLLLDRSSTDKDQNRSAVHTLTQQELNMYCMLTLRTYVPWSTCRTHC